AATGRRGGRWHASRTVARRLRADPPDLCVLIDFPEFNLRLARVAKRAGVPVLYYIGPQVWAWRRGRVRKIARRVDRLAVVFPFEPALYTPRLAKVEFVGHPLLDRVRGTRGPAQTPAAPQCALLERPMVIVYRLGPLSYGLGRLLVRGVRFIGMPNIVAGREVVPELLQRQATGPRIAAAARALLDDRARHAAMIEDL